MNNNPNVDPAWVACYEKYANLTDSEVSQIYAERFDCTLSDVEDMIAQLAEEDYWTNNVKL